MDERLYLVTGADGHLGSAVLRELMSRGERVRGLILPGGRREFPDLVSYYEGDVRREESLEDFFAVDRKVRVICIHTAGVVDIKGRLSKKLYETNVLGTKNIIRMCRKHRVSRLIYTSSVHAIPENGRYDVIREIDDFSIYRNIKGGYARTKAMASLCVLKAAKKGLDAIVLHPSGIIGPYDREGNHLVQFIRDYLHGRLPACVNGTYDFVDVRDVAFACIQAAEIGRAGECYILSNQRYSLSQLLDYIREYAGGPELPVLPVAVARFAAPFLGLYCKCTGQRPLFTAYSLHTIRSNSHFSHARATAELNYHPRDIRETVRDTVDWIEKEE